VFEALQRPMMAEEVAVAAGLTLPQALGALIGLEMRGLIAGQGGRYRASAQAVETPQVPQPG
jgi:predicted Rossmann fold nucleotide-binding protein DprA/Smf involved in DNA uptake